MTGIGRSLKIVAVGAVALAGALVVQLGPVSAQTAPAPVGAMPMPERFADAVEIRIALLHRALRIMPSQEVLFRAYADVIRSNAQVVNALFVVRSQATDLSAPARLRWYAQLTGAHAEAVNKLIAPFDALYQSLSPDQKVLADRHFEQLQQRRMARRDR
jgi:LTXXQ motif family protein